MRLRVTVNGSAYEVEVDVLEDRDGLMQAGTAAYMPQTISLNQAPMRPQKVTASATPAVPPPIQAAAEGPTLTSPIPGTIVEINAAVGQTVKLGDAVIVIDAMKMHTQITATQNGVIKTILVKPGEVVQMGQPLIVFEG